jgi:hypothetical protein
MGAIAEFLICSAIAMGLLWAYFYSRSRTGD